MLLDSKPPPEKKSDEEFLTVYVQKKKLPVNSASAVPNTYFSFEKKYIVLI